MDRQTERMTTIRSGTESVMNKKEKKKRTEKIFDL